MKLIYFDGQYWTGDRWSNHIGEAKRYRKRTTLSEDLRYLRDRGFNAHSMGAPNLKDWGNDD